MSRLLLAALLATATPVAAQTAPAETLFTNVRVFDGTNPKLSAPTSVLVRGNTIAEIGPRLANKGTVIDGRGRTLMPGLIDNHVHITMSASSQADLVDPKITPEVLEARALAEADAMLMRGFTAVRDLGGPIFAVKASIDSGKTNGPRIWPSGAMVSQTSGHGDGRLPDERSRRWGGAVSRGELLGAYYIADGRAEVLTAVREDLRGGASQIKVMAGGGAATAYDPLDVAQYTFDELKAAVEAADDWNTYVTVHAYTPKAVRRSVDAGVKRIEARPAARRTDGEIAGGQGRLAQSAGARSRATDSAPKRRAPRSSKSSTAPTRRIAGPRRTTSSWPGAPTICSTSSRTSIRARTSPS